MELPKPQSRLPLLCVKSPKSVALPVDAIVIKSITLELLGDDRFGLAPPAIIPRVDDSHDAQLEVPLFKSPKSCAVPIAAIVI